MQENTLKLRINLEKRELEIDGDKDFIIENFGDIIHEYLGIIKTAEKVNIKDGAPSNQKINLNNSSSTDSQLPDSFGEYYIKFPRGQSNVDKLLVAGYFIQCRSDDKTFSVKDAADLLLEQGVKLSNSSAFNKSNAATKRVFPLNGKWRVSDIGVDYIKSLATT